MRGQWNINKKLRNCVLFVVQCEHDQEFEQLLRFFDCLIGVVPCQFFFFLVNNVNCWVDCCELRSLWFFELLVMFCVGDSLCCSWLLRFSGSELRTANTKPLVSDVAPIPPLKEDANLFNCCFFSLRSEIYHNNKTKYQQY